MMTLIIPRKEAPVSGEGTVVIPQPAGDEPVIKNTFFFPDIDPKRVRERMRLEQTVAPARLREAIKSGMAETNAELYDLSKDANETQNLAAEHPGLTEELSKSLLAWWERRPRINIQKEVK